jgi:hypothetical protein
MREEFALTIKIIIFTNESQPGGGQVRGSIVANERADMLMNNHNGSCYLGSLGCLPSLKSKY